MKNRFSYKTSLMLLLTLIASMVLSFAAFSAQGTISFSDPEVTVGDEVNVTMKITADEGTSLSNANVVLTYPSEKLEFIDGTDSDGGAGAIRVHGTTNGGGTAVLEYNLRFNTLSAGAAAITIDSYEVYDSDDQPVEMTHLGNSAVTINAEDTASADSSLGTLEVYPGELSPEFSADNDTYDVTVGLGVERLTINAIPSDSSASVSINNNDALPEGDSTVTIVVSAADGTSSSTYTINVSKVEGGPENVISDSSETEVVEGVQLSAKGKTITIMSPGDDVEVPQGLKSGTIKIDDQQVQGWVWAADDDPEYCVVYGMNDRGEVNFYRYDMVEKTIQRYFEDPIAAGAVSGAEYESLMSEKDAAVNSSNFRFAVICVLAAICFVLIMVIVYMNLKIRNQSKNRGSARAAEERVRKRRNRSDDTNERASLENFDDSELLKHDFTEPAKPESEEDQSAVDETQVIRRPERKRKARRAVSSSGAFPQPVKEAAEDTAGTAPEDIVSETLPEEAKPSAQDMETQTLDDTDTSEE